MQEIAHPQPRVTIVMTARERHSLAEAARSANGVAPASMLTVLEAELIAIDAANEIDMHVSGEVRYSGRTDVLGSRLLESAGPWSTTTSSPHLARGKRDGPRPGHDRAAEAAARGRTPRRMAMIRDDVRPPRQA